MAHENANTAADPDAGYQDFAKAYSRIITGTADRLVEVLKQPRGGEDGRIRESQLQLNAENIRDLTRSEHVAPHAAFAAIKKAHEALRNEPETQALIIEAATHLNRQVLQNDNGEVPGLADFVKQHAPRAAAAGAGRGGAGVPPR